MGSGQTPTRHIVSLRQRYLMYRELTNPLRDRILWCERLAPMEDTVVHQRSADNGDEEITAW
jgi:hypothetical protein